MILNRRAMVHRESLRSNSRSIRMWASGRISLLLVLAALALFVGRTVRAQDTPMPRSRPEAPLTLPTYRLWQGRAPRAASDAIGETPTLTMVRPMRQPKGGAAVVIAPGGGYIGLAMALEGMEPAHWFAARGITAFILKYRVGSTARLPTPLLDGARAIRFVRAHAAALGIDPGRIGMMGFSAGGHLAAMTAVTATAGDPAAADLVERASSRPDFLILAYPWLEGTAPRPDGGTSYCDFATLYDKAAGKTACNPADYAAYVPLRNVGKGVPPTFIYHTTADELVPVAGSVRFFDALVVNGVPAEIHAFENGLHGTGMGGTDVVLVHWPELLDGWLRVHGHLLPEDRRTGGA